MLESKFSLADSPVRRIFAEPLLAGYAGEMILRS